MTPASSAGGGWADLSARTKLRLRGADRVRFLNGQISNDVRLASAEASIYTCVMTIKGKMCADAFVHAASDALWVDGEPEVRESLAARLEKYIIADDVTLEDVSAEMGLLHFLPAPEDSLETAQVAILALGSANPAWRCLRSARYGQVGLDLVGPIDAIQEARCLLAKEAPLLDAESVDTRRILAGVPKWGAELDENTMPAEAGLEDRAVSFAKGCYIGQEVVSRVKSVGHVNRHLRGLRAQGGVGLVAGQSLYPPEGAAGGREAGRVTSVAADRAQPGASIALAFVRRGWESAGTMLAIDPAPGAGQALVCELPFT